MVVLDENVLIDLCKELLIPSENVDTLKRLKGFLLSGEESLKTANYVFKHLDEVTINGDYYNIKINDDYKLNLSMGSLWKSFIEIIWENIKHINFFDEESPILFEIDKWIPFLVQNQNLKRIELAETLGSDNIAKILKSLDTLELLSVDYQGYKEFSQYIQCNVTELLLHLGSVDDMIEFLQESSYHNSKTINFAVWDYLTEIKNVVDVNPVFSSITKIIFSSLSFRPDETVETYKELADKVTSLIHNLEGNFSSLNEIEFSYLSGNINDKKLEMLESALKKEFCEYNGKVNVIFKFNFILNHNMKKEAISSFKFDKNIGISPKFNVFMNILSFKY